MSVLVIGMFRNDKEWDVLEQQDPINDVFTYPPGISMIFRRFCFNRINFLFTINNTELDNVKNKKVKTDKFHWYHCQQKNFLCELFHVIFFFVIF